MNILFVTAYPPVLHRHGGGVRMYHNIRILSCRHSVHVLSFVGSDEEQDLLDSVKSICESVRGIRRIPDFSPHWLSLKPFLVREFSTPEMYQAVGSSLRDRQIDVLQCEYLQMAQFRRNGVSSVLTAHEALSRNAHDAFIGETDPFEKLRLFYRWMQMLRYEVAQIREFDRVVTMTAADADYLKSYAPEAKVQAIPIGIDPEEFRPLPEQAGLEASVLFVGNFLHSPNVEAARFLALKIAPRFPAVQFTIVGAPAPEDLPSDANVRVRGHVAEIRPFYRGPDTIVVAPLFSGTGQRVKLLEAFSMACPVITTEVGASGFPIEDGVHATIAGTADEFVAALRRLLKDAALRCRLGENARAMIVDRFGWDRIGEELLNVVEEVAVSN